MPRNRHTKHVRKIQRDQVARQEAELAAIERRLHIQDAEPMEVPAVNENKARRSTRVEQKRRHKAKRRASTSGGGDQK